MLGGEALRPEPGQPLADRVVAYMAGVAQQFDGVEKGIGRGVVGGHAVDEQQPAAGSQHARRLAHGQPGVGEMMRAYATAETVEARRREGERHGIPQPESDVRAAALGREPSIHTVYLVCFDRRVREATAQAYASLAD